MNEKQAALTTALMHGVAAVHLDPRGASVDVPASFKTQKHLVLNISYNFDPHDLIVHDLGFEATLTFKRQPFAVLVPWSAVFGIQSVATGFIAFPGSVPPELMPPARAPVRRAHLTLIPGGKA